jgi:hypothetical protein
MSHYDVARLTLAGGFLGLCMFAGWSLTGIVGF